jgi:hypothetical protein
MIFFKKRFINLERMLYVKRTKKTGIPEQWKAYPPKERETFRKISTEGNTLLLSYMEALLEIKLSTR